MFSLDKNPNRVVCLEAYARVQKGAIVPLSNELWADVEAWLAEGNELLPFDGYPDLPQEAVVPEEVSRMQAEIQLHRGGLLAQVEAIINAPETDPEVKIAWRESGVVRRNSPTVAMIASILGLTEAQIDQLFIDAAKIEQ